MERSFRIFGCGMQGFVLLSFLALAGSAAAGEIPFAPAASIDAAFGGAWSVELADLDGDGDLDAVGAANGDDDVSWWENAGGDGSSWTLHAIDVSFAGAAAVQVGDVDGDGLPDVVGAASTAGDVAWWRNDGTPAVGLWTRFSIDTAFAGARAVWLADLDRNGTLDVLAAGETANQVVWWANDGTPLDDTTDLGGGDFWVQRLVGAAPGATTLTAADLDGDGDLDVVAGGTTASTVGWWRNDGDPTDGGWVPRAIDTALTIVRWVSTADLDGDGDLDVLAAAGSGSVVTWWVNDGTPFDDTTDLGGGNFWTERTVANAFDGAFSARAVDLDGDGDLDVLAAAATDDAVAWWENDGDPSDDTSDLGGGNFWTVHTVDGAFGGAVSAVGGDLDGDGDPDLAGASSSGDLVAWWRNDTIHRSAHYPTAGEVATGDQPEGIALADLDGDGDLDLVGGRDGTANDFSWWENDGTPAVGAWSEHPVGASFAPPGDVAVGDLDGDGDLDVLFSDSGDHLVGWFENDGSACSPACAWPEHAIGDLGNARRLAVADLDGDGDLDVASQSANDQVLIWWENDGSPAGDPSWAEHGIDSGSSAICPVLAADVDGDGDLDIVSCPGSGSSLAWFANDGTPGDDTAWTAQAQILPQLTPEHAVAADLDGDGDVDVAAAFGLTASIEEQFFAWWENTAGDGSAWSRHDVAAPVNVNGLAEGDVDGDGKPDLAAADSTGDVILWWPNRGGQFALATADLSSGGILEGASDDVLAIEATHRGRTGDSTVELLTFELLFEETPGDALSSAEANALIDDLAIYLDDGDGGFDGAFDTPVATVSPLSLTAGVQTVALPSGALVALDPGAAKTYLVVLTAAAGASAQTPNSFRVTHLTAASSTARDLEGDVPLELEHAADVATGTITAQAGCFALTLGHGGGGSDPAATPAQSTGCAAGEYVPGEVVALEATPDAGWQVTGWTGTDDDGSTATSNSVTMPSADHAASVTYAFPDELVIDGEFMTGTEVREACQTIRAGDVPDVGTPGAATVVGAGADVTLRAGQTVVFYSGFEVRSVASFRVEIASPTACQP